MPAAGKVSTQAAMIERATPQPLETVGEIFNFAHYLLDHGAVLKDGDTIGLSANQTIRVRHLVSNWDEGHRVYRLSED